MDTKRNSISLSEFMWQEVDVLLGDPAGEPGELADLVEISNAVLPDGFDAVIIFDVAIDSLLAVIGFEGDIRREETVEIEGDDFPLVCDGAREVMDVAAGGEHFSILLDFAGVCADHSVADPEENGEIELGKEGALIEGFIDPALHSFFTEGFRVEAVGDMRDVLIGDKRENDGHGAGGGDAFAPTGIFVGGDSHPDELTGVEVVEVGIE